MLFNLAPNPSFNDVIPGFLKGFRSSAAPALCMGDTEAEDDEVKSIPSTFLTPRIWDAANRGIKS